MKKTKLAVLFAAAVAMVGFTSCLGGNDNYENRATGMEYVKVEGFTGYYQFENAAEFTIMPTNQSDLMSISLTPGEFALLQYQYSPDSIKQNVKKVPAQIFGLAPVKEAKCRPLEEGEELVNIANMPIAKVGVMEYAFPYFSKNDLFLVVNANYKEGDKQDISDLTEGRSFTLTYAPDEETSYDGPVFVLNQYVNNLSLNSERNKEDAALFLHFNIGPAIEQYKVNNEGRLPSNIYVKYQVPSYSGNLEERLDYSKSQEVSTPFRLEYRRYFEQ